MRHALHAALQGGLWALAPVLDETGVHDSPSLIVMPLSAALAALASRDWRWGLGMPASALAVVLLGYTVWSVATGRETLVPAARFAVGMIPFHLLGTWLLVAVFWWPARKARSLAVAA